MDNDIKEMMEFSKEMGIEVDSYEKANLSERGMLAIKAERKKRGKDKGESLEDVEEDDDEEEDEEEKKDDKFKAKPGPG